MLRVLDRAPYYRLGGHKKIAADVRVVAATNRDLKTEVSSGKFRKDLYHRLCQLELYVPPLRERPEDIAALAKHLLEHESPSLRFTPEAIAILQDYAWPGNVRELQNTVNKLAIYSEEEDISAEAVEKHFLSSGEALKVDRPSLQLQESFGGPDFDEQAIRKALQATKGHRGQAAAELGISRRTLSRKLRTYGLSSKHRAAQVINVPDDGGRQNYRAEILVPVTIKTPDGLEFECRATNLSESGIGIEGLETTIGPRTTVKITFQIPDAESALTTTARVAWDDKRGGVGLLFTAIDSPALKEVRRWLLTQMADEALKHTNTLCEPGMVSSSAEQG